MIMMIGFYILDEEMVQVHIINMSTIISQPYTIRMLTTTFDSSLGVETTTRGKHETIGIIMTQKIEFGNGWQLQDCRVSTLAARMQELNSTLRNSFLT